jgi:hypothetical protein
LGEKEFLNFDHFQAKTGRAVISAVFTARPKNPPARHFLKKNFARAFSTYCEVQHL